MTLENAEPPDPPAKGRKEIALAVKFQEVVILSAAKNPRICFAVACS
jgi:hypothetical protein